MQIELSGLRIAFDTPAKMCQAPLVAEVTVESYGTAHWNSVSGLGPSDRDRRRLVRHGYAIYTPLTFTHFRALFDRRSGPTHEFVMPRGQVGTDSYVFASFPLLAPGGHYVVVFTPSVLAEQPSPNAAVLLTYHAFPIDDHGVVLLQRGGAPTEPGVGASTPQVTMPLSQLRAQLASCI